MNTMVNMIVMLEKELEGEQHGLRRSARYVGNLRQMSDLRWHRGEVRTAAEPRQLLDAGGPEAAIETRLQAHRSLLSRLFHQPRAHHQETCGEC